MESVLRSYLSSNSQPQHLMNWSKNCQQNGGKKMKISNEIIPQKEWTLGTKNYSSGILSQTRSKPLVKNGNPFGKI